MGKNDFDIDFDFEKEYGLDPKDFLDSDEHDDIDLSEFSDEDLGLTPSDGDADADIYGQDFADGEASDDAYGQEDDLDAFLNMRKERAEENPQDTDDYSEEDFNPEEDYPEEEELRGDAFGQDDYAEDYQEDSDEEESAQYQKQRSRKARKMPKITLPKIAMPNIFGKFVDVYFAPMRNKEMREGPVDPDNPRRRRRKSPSQIFKEVYLPPLIACVCLILVMSFAVGSLSDFIQAKRDEADRKQSQQSSSISAAEQEAQRIQQIMDEAEALAMGYDYNGAIAKLETVGNLTEYTDVAAKRSEYVQAQQQLVEHNDPSLIPNLSFHVLIEDMTRALADKELGGSYNRNFVTTSEFKKILNQLYNNGYVLVDYDSFVGASVDTAGNDLFEKVPIALPADKKPIMITETMVNYFAYMIDGDGDTQKLPDAKGDGFASRLVVKNGEIKAEYVDASGQTLVGDYDLVPILESFIKEHPDFSYRGARAVLAVTGYEGIFGYRCNTSYISTVSQEYYDQEVAGAKEIVQTLRDKGYTLACYTYNNATYGAYSVQQITADLQSWKQQIVPIIGDVDVFVFAKTSNISDYTGQAFQTMFNEGFRYFVAHGNEPWAEVNKTYVRQNRLMVTGEYMQWYAQNFNGIFDPAAVLDLTIRGNIPKGA